MLQEVSLYFDNEETGLMLRGMLVRQQRRIFVIKKRLLWLLDKIAISVQVTYRRNKGGSARSATYKLRLRNGDKGNTVRYEPMPAFTTRV
ncbi:hypothetical protein JYK21_02540 [Ralstonia pickettii]|nr:hypothetical protein [Ralstonia pickettii]